MHELGITERLLEVVLARAAAAGATKVTDVHLEVGDDSGVAPESVAFYWPQVSRATLAEGASLDFGTTEDPLTCRVVAIDVEDGSGA